MAAWHGMAWHCMALHGMALHGMALHCIAWHGIALHWIAWHCIALHGMALHCIARCSPCCATLRSSCVCNLKASTECSSARGPLSSPQLFGALPRSNVRTAASLGSCSAAAHGRALYGAPAGSVAAAHKDHSNIRPIRHARQRAPRDLQRHTVEGCTDSSRA